MLRMHLRATQLTIGIISGLFSVTALAADTPPPAAAQTPPAQTQPVAAAASIPNVKVAASTRDLWADGVDVDHVDGTTIYYKPIEGAQGKPNRVPAPLDTKLFDIKYLGPMVSTEGGLPFLLMSARPCSDCNEEKQIYAVRVDGGRSTHFVYPGKILDPKTRAVLFDARSFFGKCLPHGEQGYIVFQRERLDRRRSLQPSVFVASAGKDFLEEKLIEHHLPGLNTTLAQVKRKQCVEIVGRNRLMLRKKMSLVPRREEKQDEDDGDDDEESTKENQTDQDLPSPAAD